MNTNSQQRRSYSNSQSKSESIQIFKINPETKDYNNKEINLNFIKEDKVVTNTNFNQIINIEKDNYGGKDNQMIKPINCNIPEISKVNSKMLQIPQVNDPSPLNTSSINLNISERMSKIENKLNNIKINASLNLDSRVKSFNDMSAYDESKIIKNKSFLSGA
jgi:hypothetical protein